MVRLLEKQVRQLEFEFMKEMRKDRKRKARQDLFFLPFLLLMLSMPYITLADESEIIKKDYSETIEKMPSYLQPYVSIGFPYF